MEKFRKIGSIIVLFLLIFSLSSCKKGKIDMNKEIYAQIEFTNNDKINLELYHDIAPKSVENFVELAQKGFYKDVVFHRIIADFMIQAGGYKIIDNTLSLAGEAKTIKGEFKENGVENNLKHELGVISMARTSDPNSGSSQFFICAATCSWLDGSYAAFGKTTDKESNDVVLKISKLQTYQPHYTLTDFPVEPVIIKEVRVSNNKF